MLKRNILTLGQVELGIEQPTFQFVDNLHEPLPLLSLPYGL